MRIRLTKPVLTGDDYIDLQTMCTAYGYELDIDEGKGKYLLLGVNPRGEEDVAYIQRHESFGLNIVWRKTEQIQFVEQLLHLSDLFDEHRMLPLDTDDRTFGQCFIKAVKTFLWK